MTTPNTPVEQYRSLAKLEEARRTVRLATARCVGADELIRQIPELWELSDPSSTVYHLEEIDLSPQQSESLATALGELAVAADQLPSRSKGQIDRYLFRLARALPTPLSARFAVEMLGHHRKVRRDIAYKLLRKAGFPLRLLSRLVSLYEQTGDEEVLHIIARKPAAVAKLDPRFLLESITEEYWRMRVVEALLKTSPEVSRALAPQYPREFVWAVGRLEAGSELALIVRLCSRTDDCDLVSLYAWVLGKHG